MLPPTWGARGGSTSLGVFKQLLKSMFLWDSNIQEAFEVSQPVTDMVDKIPCHHDNQTWDTHICKLHTYIHAYTHTYIYIYIIQ